MKRKNKQSYITPTEWGLLQQPPLKLNAVTKRIRKDGKLDGVRRIEKYGRFYLLEI